MKTSYSFSPIDGANLNFIKKAWLKELIGPQDGMWESFRERADQIGIFHVEQVIGYASVGEDNQLIQFFVTDNHISNSHFILRELTINHNISKAIVGTNNPVFLTAALGISNTLDLHTYLFRGTIHAQIEEKAGNLVQCQSEDLQTVVDFYHETIGAPKEWLVGYLGDHISKGEVFCLRQGSDIMGACEVRVSETHPSYADIGMLVSPIYRRKGYGTYLLHKAKTIAEEWGKIPICSCEKSNLGSFKSITNCGFVSKDQLLKITF